jgi:hypothetical protein
MNQKEKELFIKLADKFKSNQKDCVPLNDEITPYNAARRGEWTAWGWAEADLRDLINDID